MHFLWLCVVALSLCSQVFCTEKPKTKLHALIIYDSGKSELKSYHKADSKIMKETVKKIAHLTKAKLCLKVIEKQYFSIKNLHRYLNKIQSSRDTVIVYYSGAECYNPEYTGIWPSISLCKGKNTSIISSDKLSQLVQEKQPRLSFVLMDYYDNFIVLSKQDYANLINPLKRNFPTGFISKYWPKTTGNILACSHTKDGAGYGLKKGKLRRGVFTQSLLYTFTRITPTGYASVLEREMYDHFSWLRQQPLTENSLKCPLSTVGTK